MYTILILDSNSKKVIFKTEIRNGYTVDKIVSLIKIAKHKYDIDSLVEKVVDEVIDCDIILQKR